MFGSLIPERSGEAPCVPCMALAGAIQQAFTTTQDDTYTNVAYMDAITTEFTNRGFTLPDMITSVDDVFTQCDFTLTIIEGIGTDPDVAEITWGQDADRKRAYCGEGIHTQLSFTNENGNGYRFGFNGQECDSEVSGVGNTYAFEYRMHDARIGRFMSVDPLADEYSYNSPYAFAEDKPILSVDLEGLETPVRINFNEKKTSAASNSTPPKQDQIGPSLDFEPNRDLFKKYIDSPVTYYPFNPALGYQEQVFIKAPLRFIYSSLDALYTFPQIFLDDFMPGEPRHMNGDLVGEGYHRTNAAMNGIVAGTLFLPTPKTPRFGKGVGLEDLQLCNPSQKFGFNWVVEPHGNSLKSLKPTWGYKLYSNDGTFLKNGITSKLVAESRYSKAFMENKYMIKELFPHRRGAWEWEFNQNQIQRGPLNLNSH